MELDTQKSLIAALNACDREPIHIPGAVQPHGVLLGIDGDGMIRLVSANSLVLLGRHTGELIGAPLAQLLSLEDLAILSASALIDPIKQVNPLKLSIKIPGKTSDGHFDGILHRSGGLLILELEPISEPPPAGFSYAQQRAMARIQATTEVRPLCQTVAEEVRQLTGFDRVMVYRFHTGVSPIASVCPRIACPPSLS